MEFEDAEFDATAASWDNPDWVETTLYAYRVRWGAAPKDPRYFGTHPHLESTQTMSINIKTTGANHVALRCTDLARARRFYTETLGFPILAETPELFLIQAGSTAIGLRAPTPDTAPGDTFHDSRVGLDHIALGCESEAELERVAAALSAEGIKNTGIKTDEVLGHRYVAFNDPDGIIWELYMA